MFWLSHSFPYPAAGIFSAADQCLPFPTLHVKFIVASIAIESVTLVPKISRA
jgi:hypothetical protein